MANSVRSNNIETEGANYEYTPLNGPRQIRILRLFKSKNAHDPLCGRLFERSLDKRWPMYQAVSYTWGGQHPDRSILIDGKRLAITKNCEDFLLNYRDPKEVPTTRMFWVDSICINQKDDSEKSKQVQMMSEIYTRCVEVLVWLGPATKESDECFQLIRKSHKISRWSFLLPKKTVNAHYDKLIHALQSQPKLLQDVALRPWFGRVWTIQEVAASNFAPMYCGKEKLLMRSFFSVYEMATSGSGASYVNMPATIETRERVSLHYRIRTAIRGPNLLDKVRYSANINTTELLRDIRKCGATDPRDKIFALHSVLSRAGLRLPAPDYTKALDKVYHSAVVAFLTRPSDMRSLEILQLVTGNENSELIGAPSWVPDLSEESPPWPVFDSTWNGIEPEFTLENDNRHLCTWGILVDRIEMASKKTVWHPESPLDLDGNLTWETLEHGAQQTVAALQDWITIASSLETYTPTGQTREEAFFATIGAERGDSQIHAMETIRGHYRETKGRNPRITDNMTQYLMDCDAADMLRYMEEHSFENDAKSWWSILMANIEDFGDSNMDTLKELCGKASKYSLVKSKFGEQFDLAARTESAEWKMLLTLSAITGYCDSILTLCRKNTFFRTETGLLGAAPMSVRDGDTIVLIPGLTCPLVVRPSGNHHRLVAPAYVHGMMKSERMKALEAVSNQNGDVSAMNMYIDLTLV